MNKLIPKFQTPWGPIMQSDNTRVAPIVTQPVVPNFTRLNKSKLGKAVLHKVKKENPDFYNKKVRLEAHKAKPNSEIVRYEDAKGKTRTSSKVIGMSGSDPVASLYVEGVALNPAFKLAGRAAQWGLAKAGNNWARAKILSKELDNSPIVSSTLRPKPIIRTKVGDIEINNPELYYRQGSKEMADDFLKTGIVNTDGAYSNPMFAQGHLWYGIPKRFTKREEIKIGKLKLSKRNEDVPKTHLLVSNPSTPMVGANHKSGISNNTVHVTKSYPISDKDKFIYKEYLGDDFVNQYQKAYYNGDLDKDYATEVFYSGNSRRVPATKGGANKSNTQLYEYDSKYGYKLIQKQPKTFVF